MAISIFIFKLMLASAVVLVLAGCVFVEVIHEYCKRHVDGVQGEDTKKEIKTE